MLLIVYNHLVFILMGPSPPDGPQLRRGRSCHVCSLVTYRWFFILFLIVALAFPAAADPGDSLNVTLEGRWADGRSWAVCAVGQPRLLRQRGHPGNLGLHQRRLSRRRPGPDCHTLGHLRHRSRRRLRLPGQLQGGRAGRRRQQLAGAGRRRQLADRRRCLSDHP